MSDESRSLLLGTLGLWVVAVLAAVLTWRRRVRSREAVAEARVAGWYVGTIALQFTHFAEEFINGFHWRFPEALGLAPWSARFFVNLNLACLAVWFFSVPLVRRGVGVAFFPAWFLAIAALANVVGHPLLALDAGGYFPGLWTCLPLGLAGGMLARQLARATSR